MLEYNSDDEEDNIRIVRNNVEFFIEAINDLQNDVHILSKEENRDMNQEKRLELSQQLLPLTRT